MRYDNPEVVQPEDWARPDSFSGSSTPVFLIHDGGGTTFAYHCLDPLYRFVYGIRNPHFFSDDIFAGGLPEMARLYAKYIMSTVSQANFPAKRNSDGSVDILLGGWSLGGMLSLEVAKVLADDWLVHVVGILMVDTVYPFVPKDYGGVIVPLGAGKQGKSKNQIASLRCMSEAKRMVNEWQIPVWDDRLAGKRPRMVLVRGSDYIPTGSCGISELDVFREDFILGWGAHDENMFDAVIDVQGHHFDLFVKDRVVATTAAMRQGLDYLNGAASLRKNWGEQKRMLHL